jgi:O-6-methylguanine DNA methyltransferase
MSEREVERTGDQAITAAEGDQPGWGVLALPTLGPMWMAWSARGLVLLEQRAPGVDRASRIARWLPELSADSAPRDIPERFASLLRDYDRGVAVDPAKVPVDLRGTEFQNRVWEALRAVPRGQVRTYGGLASDAGAPRAMRAVGMAMAKNPLPVVVPCHRVIANGSRIGGYSDGLPRKRVLLGLEGVSIDGDLVRAGQLDLI